MVVLVFLYLYKPSNVGIKNVLGKEQNELSKKKNVSSSEA